MFPSHPLSYIDDDSGNDDGDDPFSDDDNDTNSNINYVYNTNIKKINNANHTNNKTEERNKNSVIIYSS